MVIIEAEIHHTRCQKKGEKTEDAEEAAAGIVLTEKIARYPAERNYCALQEKDRGYSRKNEIKRHEHDPHRREMIGTEYISDGKSPAMDHLPEDSIVIT